MKILVIIMNSKIIQTLNNNYNKMKIILSFKNKYKFHNKNKYNNKKKKLIC